MQFYSSTGTNYDVWACNGNQISTTTLCPGLNLCDDILTDGRRSHFVTAANHKLCPGFDSTPYIFKKSMGSSVEPVWQDCYIFLQEVARKGGIDGTYRTTGFTTKNMWYFDATDATSMASLCADSKNPTKTKFPCKPTWLDFSVTAELYTALRDEDLRKCFSYEENLGGDLIAYRKADPHRNPCLGYYDSR